MHQLQVIFLLLLTRSLKLQCWWTREAPEEGTESLAFDFFDIEQDLKCLWIQTVSSKASVKGWSHLYMGCEVFVCLTVFWDIWGLHHGQCLIWFSASRDWQLCEKSHLWDVRANICCFANFFSVMSGNNFVDKQCLLDALSVLKLNNHCRRLSRFVSIRRGSSWRQGAAAPWTLYFLGLLMLYSLRWFCRIIQCCQGPRKIV